MLYLLMPKFRMSKKPEEQIPTLFKNIGYPFTIQKSYLHSCGASGSWATLLGALTWLKNRIEVTSA